GIPVGKSLRDHVGVGFVYDATPALRREIAAYAARNPPFFAQVCVLARSPACPEHLWDLFVYPWLERDWSISAAVVAMKPRSTGTVALNGPDPATPLAIDHGFLSDRRDAEVLTHGIEVLRDIVRRDPVAAYAGRETLPGAHIRAGIYARAGARGFYHPVGTCPIGPVVDRTGAVHGHEGLYVADASIMPSIPRANTNLTVAAIAERIARHLAERDGGRGIATVVGVE
ncbi:MAG TPA: GMC family oxidoreductase, partial [Actinomycetota bacterium]|nr:GMC family oxidoreductase [Actinomycetota bacterium]